MLGRAEGLADTSTFVAVEQGRPLRARLPGRLAVSYVSVAELRVGVLHASTPDERIRRQRTLLRAEGLRPLPVDGRVAAAWAELRTALRDAKRRMAANDSWIAATAIAHGLPVVTQDDDYADLPGVEVIRL